MAVMKHLALGNALCALALALIGVPLAASADAPAPDAPRPAAKSTVIVLSLANDGPLADWERRLTAEFRLIFDETNVAVQIAPEGFRSFELPRKLEHLRRLMAERSASAVMWFEAEPDNSVRFFLFLGGDGADRSRTILFKDTTVSASTMALAVHEVLVEELSAVLPGPLSAPSPPAAKPRPKGFRNELGLGLGGEAGTGILGQKGAFARAGGRAVVGLLPKRGLRFNLFVGANAGPFQDMRSFRVSGVWIEPGIEAGWGFVAGPLALGPLVGISAPWSKVKLKYNEGGALDLSDWNLRCAAGSFLAWFFHAPWSLLIDATMGLFARREVYKWPSSGVVELTSPNLDWKATVGLVFTFERKESAVDLR